MNGNKEKVLVLGAGGYIGARLCEHFNKEFYDLYGTMNSSIPDDRNWLENFQQIFIGDIREEKIWEQISKVKYSYIINLISLDHSQSEQKDFQYVQEININPTWKVFNNLSVEKLKKYFYFSTIHVYDQQLKGQINEDDELSPKNIYGLTHQLSENISNYYSTKYEVNTMNLRLSNVYGSPKFMNNKCWNLVINDFCKNAIQKSQIQINSDGKPFRDFIYIEDVIETVQNLLTSNLTGANSINLTSNCSYQIADIANKVKNEYELLYNKKLKIIDKNSKDFVFFESSPINQFDNSTLKSLNIKYRWDINRGIRETLKYLINNDK